MTNAEMIAVIQAYDRGEKIQWRRMAGYGIPVQPWGTLNHPAVQFDFSGYEYRLAPMPKEIWVNEYVGTPRLAHNGYATAEMARTAAANPSRIAVRYREVMDE